MSNHFAARFALTLATAAVLVAGLIPAVSGGAAASSSRIAVPLASGGGGDFIIRCFYNGNAVTEDPIDGPGSSNTDHLHVFFGNMVSGGTAGDGTSFADIQSGDYATSGDTMESNGLTLATNCQDSKDTAGYWMPEPFRVNSSGSASVLGDLGNGCSTSCSTSTDVYQRDYYDPHGSAANLEIPDGTIMIAGYPLGCTTVNGITPTGCSSTGSPSYPVDVGVSGIPIIVEYNCSGNQNDGAIGSGKGNATPNSSWPYNCGNYLDSDDNWFDGPVAIINFPDCWDGKPGDFPAPNSPAVNGLPAHTVPGYIPPWVPTPSAWKQKYPNMSTPANDFAYPPNGSVNCDSTGTYPDPVVQLSERIHLVNADTSNWGEPSTCTGISNIGWNSTNNIETSTNSTDTSPGGDGDNDATVQVNSNPTLYGFHKCVAASSPSPRASALTLSFACTHSSSGQSDPNCNVPLSSPTGCASPGGTCYVGAWQYGWETLHADYWQTWQEGSSTKASDAGSLQDLIEDCTNGTNGACSFVTNSTPSQVYGSPPP